MPPRHLNVQDALRERQAANVMEARIRVALNSPERSSAAFVAAAIEWAGKQTNEVDKSSGDEDSDDHQRSMHEETLVTAAMIADRDGGAELVSIHKDWIRETFLCAMKGKNDPVHRIRAGLQFNPIAIAVETLAPKT